MTLSIVAILLVTLNDSEVDTEVELNLRDQIQLSRPD